MECSGANNFNLNLGKLFEFDKFLHKIISFINLLIFLPIYIYDKCPFIRLFRRESHGDLEVSFTNILKT